MNKIRIYGYVLLACSLLVASTTPIAFSLGSGIPVLTLLFYAAIAGTITSFFMMLAKGTSSQLKNLLHDRVHIAALFALGALAYVMEPLGLAYATHYVSADLAAVVFRTWPIILLLLAPFIIRERITKWEVAGVLMGFFGLAITLIGGTPISIPAEYLPFVGVLLFAAFADALANAISKRYNYELISSIFVYNIVALVIFAPMVLYSGAWQLPAVTPGIAFSILFIGVIFFAVFGYTFYESLRLVKTSFASTSYIVCSFITMLLSAVFLGQGVQLSYIVIAIAVIAGVLIQRLAPKGAGNFVISKKRNTDPSHATIYDVTSAFINTKSPGIYNTMKGGGRVLAFYVNADQAGAPSASKLAGMSRETCILFTDRHKMASREEIEFIREITGCTEKHLIVLGSGNPETVMDRFYELNHAMSLDADATKPG